MESALYPRIANEAEVISSTLLRNKQGDVRSKVLEMEGACLHRLTLEPSFYD